MGSLLPRWLELVWAGAFAGVMVSHLRHMMRARDQRRAWHACHVLMAAGMGFMYLPATYSSAAIPPDFWQVVFAVTGMIAAGWALAGIGRTSTVVWMLTALDLGAMLLMWSGGAMSAATPLIWLVIAYLGLEAGLWLLDVYRRLDGTVPLVSWSLFSGQTVGVQLSGSSAGLLGEVDISASMVVMTLGMAYMLVAMLVA